LDRVAADVMRPSLARGDLAGGIGLGLDAVAADLRQPAPASSDAAAERPRRDPLDPFGWAFGSWFWIVFAALAVFSLVRRLLGFGGGRGGSDSSSSSWSHTSSSGGGGSASSDGSSGGTSF
jgi:hypothetical protein